MAADYLAGGLTFTASSFIVPVGTVTDSFYVDVSATVLGSVAGAQWVPLDGPGATLFSMDLAGTGDLWVTGSRTTTPSIFSISVAALVTDMLLSAVPLDRFRVPLPVLLLVVGMRIAPLLPAILYHLGVEGIGANLFAVIIPAALPLTRGPAANDLLRMISGRLKSLLAVRATAITHQAAPD